MLYYDRIYVSDGIDVNKTSESKEGDICHYLCFLNHSFTFQPNACNRGDGLLIMSISYISILNIKDSDYCSIISLISKNETIKMIWPKKRNIIKHKGFIFIYYKNG